MVNDVILVPVPLLLDADVPASAKIVWMAARLEPTPEQAGIAVGPGTALLPNASWVTAATGLSRPTVLAGFRHLTTAGWDPRSVHPPGGTVPVPAQLLTNHKLGVHARILYGILLLTPGFEHPCGRTTFDQLTALSHLSRNTVAKALDQLAHAEWIKVERANRLAPIHFELTFPGLNRGLTALARAQRRLAKPGHYGESLMKEYLSLLIDSEDFEDNATPGFLVNPRTDERLEFDRFYPPTVAFEFNGPHHERATKQIPLELSIAQRERDYIKLGISVTRGITLVVIHSEDLSLKQMQQKVGHLLPLRDLTGYDLLIEYLESESRVYQRRIARL